MANKIKNIKKTFFSKARSRILLALLTFSFLITLTASTASAYPVLQLYIPDATYDAVTETWTVDTPVFDLWIIGNVAAFGTIYDVKLAAAFWGTGGSIEFTPTSGAPLIFDPSVPTFDPDSAITVDSINYPQSGVGSNDPLPDHGIYDDPTLNSWTNFYLGDMNLTDSPIGDFMTSFPGSFDSTGQINAYTVAITGWDRVHFDAFDHTVMSTGSGDKIKYWKAPFSHDAGGGGVIPEPSTYLLLGSGLIGLGFLKRKYYKSRS
ncbi:MAG: choice-of-anchor N protein [Thermodesulfobacteriota bacterium]